MFNADVDTFLDVAVADDLVHDDTDGARGNIVHNPCPANIRCK